MYRGKNMIKVEKTVPDSFFKVVLYETRTYEDLNESSPRYRDDKVDVISITPVGTDKYGNPLLCYELRYKK